MHPQFEYVLVTREGHETEVVAIAASRLESMSNLLGPHTVVGTLKGTD